MMLIGIPLTSTPLRYNVCKWNKCLPEANTPAYSKSFNLVIQVQFLYRDANKIFRSGKDSLKITNIGDFVNTSKDNLIIIVQRKIQGICKYQHLLTMKPNLLGLVFKKPSLLICSPNGSALNLRLKMAKHHDLTMCNEPKLHPTALHVSMT